jgi:hypothetical protein
MEVGVRGSHVLQPVDLHDEESEKMAGGDVAGGAYLAVQRSCCSCGGSDVWRSSGRHNVTKRRNGRNEVRVSEIS